MVEGVISKINSRPFGNKTFYSFALSGQDGFYGTGLKRPPVEGTSVRFESKTNSKGYKDVDGAIEIRTDGEIGPSGSVKQLSQSVGNSGKSGANGGAYWDRKEARDLVNDELRELGASRNTALAVIDLMIKHEAVRLPAVAKREEFIWTLIDKYVDKLRGKVDQAEAQQTEKKTVAQAQIDKLVDKIVEETVEEWT